MASQRSWMASIGITALGVITGAAAVLGIGAIGWKAAIEFHRFGTDVNVMRSSAIITDQDKQIQELRQQLADRDKQIADYVKNAIPVIQKAQQAPTDANWEVLNGQYALLLADVLRVKASNMDAPSMKGILDKSVSMRRAAVTAAGLMQNVTRDGAEYTYMTKFPQLGWVKVDTGELVLPKQ